jgi:NADH-quinone oxidoreductase subunit F
LRNCGKINPERIEDYIAIGGYESAKKRYINDSEEIIDVIKKSRAARPRRRGFSTGQNGNSAVSLRHV